MTRKRKQRHVQRGPSPGDLVSNLVDPACANFYLALANDGYTVTLAGLTPNASFELKLEASHVSWSRPSSRCQWWVWTSL